MITRNEGYKILTEHLKSQNLIKHCIATESVMRKLADKFGQDKEVWGLTGLLHDLDLDIVNNDMNRHALKTAEVLQQYDIPEEIITAVKAHNKEYTGVIPDSLLSKTLRPAETITGLIVATALVYPDKKIASVKPKSVRKRMKEKAFARSVNRETIRECENIGLELNEFIEISLDAMRDIADNIGL